MVRQSRPAFRIRGKVYGTRTSALAGVVALIVPAVIAAAGSPSQGRSCPWLDRSLPAGQRVSLLLPRMTLADKIGMVSGNGSVAAIPRLCIPAMHLQDGPSGVGDGDTGVTQLPAAVSLAASWDRPLASEYGRVIGAEQRGKGNQVDLGPTVNIDRDPRWGRSFETYSEDPYLNAALSVPEIDGVQSQGVMSQVKHFAVYNQESDRNTTADDAIVSTRALHEIYLPAFWAAARQAKAASVMCSYSTINGDGACQDQYLLTDTLDQRWGFGGFVSSDWGATHSTVASANAGLDQEMPSPVHYGAALQAAVTAGQVSMATVDQMVTRILTQMFRFNDVGNARTGSPGATVTTAAHQAVSTRVAEAGTVLLKNDQSVLPLTPGGAGDVAVIGPAASAEPADSGGGSAYVTAPFSVTPLAGIKKAAGPGTGITYAQGLPADTALSPIKAGTITAPQTGTYVLALRAAGQRATLSLDGQPILVNPSLPPVSTYSVGVNLVAGHRYTLQVSGGGASARLSWATPSQLRPWIARAVAAAKAARTAVVVVSDDTESETVDRSGLNLPSAQNELISAVAAANPRTVVVIDAGAPVSMPWINRVASVVDAWYPGESNGTALAAVLFGRIDPGGHLPVTFPANLSQVPASSPAQFPGVNGRVLYSEGLDVGYRYYDAKGESPLFPFGYGLSYTTFSYSHLRVTPGRTWPGNRVTVSATVTNTGRVTGSDVAQLYLGDPAVAGEPPRQLKGFQKVTLAPGRSAMVRFTLTAHDLSYWDDAANGWMQAEGRYQVYVGDSSALASLPLRAGLTVASAVTWPFNRH
jgi:beta-glucosidase